MRPSEDNLGKLALGPVPFGTWSRLPLWGLVCFRAVSVVCSSVGVSAGLGLRRSPPLARGPVRTASLSSFLPSSLGCLATWPLQSRDRVPVWTLAGPGAPLPLDCRHRRLATLAQGAQSPQTLRAGGWDSFSAVPLVLAFWNLLQSFVLYLPVVSW